MNCDNIKQFCDRFNTVADNVDLSLDDKQFLQFWKTELAMALLKDLGNELGKDIAKTMIFLCDQC